ncbi:ribonuclease HII [bacterium]|nr:ribonuclease HII [bacterium]
MNELTKRERALLSPTVRYIAGVDEAGRGPLAGPVVAAAVIFAPDTGIDGVEDSKKLRPARRDQLADEICSVALAWATASCSAAEIDEHNILQASILAMQRAIAALDPQPDFLLVDGNRFHHPSLPFETVVKGDAHCFSIAAASILAKVERDRVMAEMDLAYPGYGFAQHKGYPTHAHVDALRRLGPSPVHRRSFTVKALVTQGEIFNDRQTETGPGG